jgi:PHP family Zn ribbon phosphoesterase
MELARHAALKGVRVVATGDFTHPGWRQEISEHLEEAGEGLFKLKKASVPESLPIPHGFAADAIRFILNVEISSIYKRNGAVRKVHNLVFMPDLDSVDRFSGKLGKIGNISSDGRPILGLDSRDLLEIALETTDQSFLVPAHIWTPWFSVLGARSGFDSIEECFGDLSHHIFALETGLSSDPEMNYTVSSLDGRTLISNSDTHSPANLGREVNIFRGEPGYSFIRDSIRNGYPDPKGPGSVEGPEGITEMEGFLGTLEFYPEEGKYHLDGHRKCNLRMWPEETLKSAGICPRCGKKVTVGVMNRVLELSDREVGLLPPGAAYFTRILPLCEVISQAVGVGPKSKKVQALQLDMVRNLGPELDILWRIPLEEMKGAARGRILEALERARMGLLSIDAGYDGEYGKVRIFSGNEPGMARLGGQAP